MTGITLAVKTTQTSYPQRSCAVLSTTDIGDSGIATMISDISGSVKLSDKGSGRVGDISISSSSFPGYITHVYATDHKGTKLTADISSGSMIYYHFKTNGAISSGTRLYVYLIRCGEPRYPGYSNSGWIASNQTNVTATVQYETTKTVRIYGHLNYNQNNSLHGKSINSYCDNISYTIGNGAAVQVGKFGDAISVPYGATFKLTVKDGTIDPSSDLDSRGHYIYIKESSKFLKDISGIKEKSYTITADTNIYIDVRNAMVVKWDATPSEQQATPAETAFDDTTCPVMGLGGKIMILSAFPYGSKVEVTSPVATMRTGWVIEGWHPSGLLSWNKTKRTGSLSLANITQDYTFVPVSRRVGAMLKYEVKENNTCSEQSISSGKSFLVGLYEGFPRTSLESPHKDKYIAGWEVHIGETAGVSHDIGQSHVATFSESDYEKLSATPIYNKKTFKIVCGENYLETTADNLNEVLQKLNTLYSAPKGAIIYEWKTPDGEKASADSVMTSAVDAIDWSSYTDSDITDWADNRYSDLPGKNNVVEVRPVVLSSLLPIVYRNINREGQWRLLAIKVYHKATGWTDCYTSLPE